ncbi:MAG: 2-oxo acid dehydrogenase subunit E2 [Chloroflexi bacterium]|nr:2-oxo acid dehydrogenase subunit E2 [Chloroflexota bacterium]
MPQLGESVAEGTIGRWLKKEGEFVKRDEPLVEIITDKVTAEMPSPAEGVLKKIVAPEGAVVPVGRDIAQVEEGGARVASEVGKPEAAAGQTAAREPAGIGAGAAAAPEVASVIEEARQVVKDAQKRSSPLVRRLAQEHGVDIGQIQGTGLGGRVTRDDILDFIARREAAAAVAGAPAPSAAPQPTFTAPPQPTYQPAPPPTPAITLGKGDEIIELTPMRRMIAEHMVRSKRTSPHAATMTEVDMTNVVKWREGIKEEFRRREGVNLTYVPFVMKATVEALRALPTMNSTWIDDKIVVRRQINLGMAVAVDAGLIVPVVHNADEKSIAGLARAVNDLADKARAGKLTLPEVQGGTFTVNNTGAFGSIVSVPIINQPQAAIMSMEAIVKRPVVIDDAIAIRSMMYLCLSFDHRIVDGAIAGRFLQKVKQWLEAFGPHVPLY